LESRPLKCSGESDLGYHTTSTPQPCGPPRPRHRRVCLRTGSGCVEPDTTSGGGCLSAPPPPRSGRAKVETVCCQSVVPLMTLCHSDLAFPGAFFVPAVAPKGCPNIAQTTVPVYLTGNSASPGWKGYPSKIGKSSPDRRTIPTAAQLRSIPAKCLIWRYLCLAVRLKSRVQVRLLG